MEIGSIENNIGLESLSLDKPKAPVGRSFKNTLISNLEKTNDSVINADKISEDFITGKTTDIHTVMMAMERAQVAMQYTIQIRNKLVEGFQQIMRMQV